MTVVNWRLNIGDRVSRPIDVYARRWVLKYGTVIRRYGQRSSFGWYDPELYEVRWDDGKIQKGFFYHGLDKL